MLTVGHPCVSYGTRLDPADDGDLGITGGGYIFGFGVAREAAGLVDEFLFPAGKARL